MTDRKEKTERGGVELSEEDLSAADGGTLQIFVKTLKAKMLPDGVGMSEVKAR